MIKKKKFLECPSQSLNLKTTEYNPLITLNKTTQVQKGQNFLHSEVKAFLNCNASQQLLPLELVLTDKMLRGHLAFHRLRLVWIASFLNKSLFHSG